MSCPDGFDFYMCAVGAFRGCCSIDPCSTGECPKSHRPDGDGGDDNEESTTSKTTSTPTPTTTTPTTTMADDHHDHEGGVTTHIHGTLTVTATPTSESSGGSSNGAVIGGAVGGVVGGLIIVGIILFVFFRRRKRARAHAVEEAGTVYGSEPKAAWSAPPPSDVNRTSDLTYASYVGSPGLSSIKSPPTDYQPIPQQSKEIPIAELPGAAEVVTPELSGGEASELPGSPTPQPPAQSPGISSLGGFSDHGHADNGGRPVQGLGLQ
ncbi:hypothetical protein VTN49DRAFT_6029 [Thermomyces lanuginosus]|uniref:uncharacterized protein n=1 Tax=Thermomyces lanuginosus TaxID=5541 RepID=UPI003743827D